MTDDVPITRRRLLAGVAGAGVLGSGAGAFTAATFGDRELLPIRTTAGAAGIAVDCDAADCVVEDGVLQFAIGDVVPGGRGSRSFTLSVDDNPVRVWMRTDCPSDADSSAGHAHGDDQSEARQPGEAHGRASRGSPGGSRSSEGWGPAPESIDEVLEIRLSVVEGCQGEGTRVYPAEGGDSWGTLRGFQATFADGQRLDRTDPCFDDGEAVCLELEYRLPEGTWVDADDESDLEIELYAEQCRHVSESAAQSPFEPRNCEPEGCHECVKLGRLEVKNDRLEEQTYGLDELEPAFEDDGHSYEVDVLGVGNKDEGETVCAEFRLLRDGEEFDRLCEVRIKGGPDRWSYEIEPPSARTHGELCTQETEAGNSGNRRQPAISHVDVFLCTDAAVDGGGDR